MPFPSRSKDLVEWSVCRPSEYLVCFVNVAPDSFDVTFATWSEFPWELNACSTFKALNDFEGRVAVTCTDVEYLYWFCLLIKYSLHCLDVCLGKVNDIDVVANASLVWSVVVIAKYLELLADADSSLSDKWNEVHWYAIWKFADEG